MKVIVLVLSLAAVTMAQRGSYAGSAPIGKPGLASRFRGDDDDASTQVNLSNRISENDRTEKIPVDARGDHDLVDRLNQWPRENRPFWLINAEHIEAQRQAVARPTGNQGGVQLASRVGGTSDVIPARAPSQRPSFAGGAPRF